MTISDEELYRLAKEAAPRPLTKRDMIGIGSCEYFDLTSLREAVLQRFKPREPRVTNGWVFVRNDGDAGFVFESRNAAECYAKIGDPKGYLAKAIITEVMEEE